MSSVSFIARGRTTICTFRIGQQACAWFVTKNNAFYGDYLTRGQAIEAASFGARAVEARGGSALVFETPGDVLIDHHPVKPNS